MGNITTAKEEMELTLIAANSKLNEPTKESADKISNVVDTLSNQIETLVKLLESYESKNSSTNVDISADMEVSYRQHIALIKGFISSVKRKLPTEESLKRRQRRKRLK